MNIKHNPIFNTDEIAEHYSKQDGVPVKYVCTSALGSEASALDIFYRETPHPEFGNRYFGIFPKGDYSGNNAAMTMITNADAIEGQTIAMIEDPFGNLIYSQHRHDFRMMNNGNMIDGGRAYVRSKGLLHNFKIKDGEFMEIKE
jgi:hypothetical protein